MTPYARAPVVYREQGSAPCRTCSRRYRHRLLLPVLVVAMFLMLLLRPPSIRGSEDFTGLTVTSITLKDDRGNPWPRPWQLLPLLDVEPGDPFSYRTVRKGIEYLYFKGLFKDIRIEGFRAGDGVRLEYILVPIVVAREIVITGNKAIGTRQIRDITDRYEGKEAHDDNLFSLRLDITALYHGEGFFDARLKLLHEKTDDPYRVIVHAEIDESMPTIIQEIRFVGNTVFSGKEMLRMMGSKRGEPLRRDQLLDVDMKALARAYTNAGYPSAKADIVGMRFRENKAYLTISGNEGPKVAVTFSGNRKISSRRLKRNLLIWSERDVSDSVIESSVEKTKNLYRENGYPDVTVEARKQEGPGRLDLAFLIEEGKRVAVDDIVITGNTVFSAKAIKKQMSLKESGWFSTNPYRNDLLEKDRDNIIDYYRDAGYLDIRIESTVTRNEEGDGATVTLRISEGTQTTVGIISIEGNTVFTFAELLERLRLRLGKPFSERLLREDRYALLAAYSGRGYLYADVRVETKPVEQSVDILYKITEDAPVRIGKVILRGNEQTRDRAILRELLVEQGDPYDYGAVLKSQQRIYRFGYFGRVKFEPVRPGKKEYVKDMILTVQERPAGAVVFGFGYGNLDRFRGFFEVSHRNLRGRARSASLRFEGSDILERAIVNYRQPWFLNRRLESNASLSWSDEKELNIDTREIYYQTRKTAATFGVDKASDGFRTSLTYQYENVDNYNVDPAAILTPEDEGRVRVSSLTPGLTWDLRDNPLNPHRGSLHGVALKEALSVLGSEAAFNKLTVQTSWYFPAGEDLVIALSARAGMARPHGKTTDVPLHERFKLGGGSTVRGYKEDLVGPPGPPSVDDLVPTGGSRMVLFNAEFRIHPGSGFGLVLFSDAGNVWDKTQKIDLDDLRASYGAGIRLNTPVGPFRLDYGQKINRQSGESPGELHFRLGHAF
ncbi:MAG TPA: outer membrane protein assembly factor BamA [Nitrospiraceae bacterium]|nr:outer membrane protein assembly factor BamA [Nitrospiraceae bacterium]